MKDINALLEKFRMINVNGQSSSHYKAMLEDIAQFYCENFGLDPDEVSILLSDSDNMVLSFAYPEHLVNAGMIPVSSPDAFAARVFKLNKGLIENNFHQMKHLHLFEYVKGPGGSVRKIWKMMSTVLRQEEYKFGVIEISRKGETAQEAGENFTQENLVFLEKTIAEFVPYLGKVLPDNFRGKLV
ncbi:MAG: hypothetical protein PHX05_06260 [Acidobacteriota bacterium]|jgi:hypothetical protein|nr:hypothetical protein [Acidobacteriota bacterium]